MRGVAVGGLLLTLVACGGTAEPPPASAAPREPTPASARDAACTSAPLTVRVDDIRREGADSLRVAVTLAHAAAAPGGAATTPATAVAEAARALEGMSLVTADGRRRLFALRASTGTRVGTPAQAPPPGGTRTFWALFPAAEGPVSVLLPGFAPLSGLPVAPLPASSEP
jgi:hypothetical protein